MLDDVGGHLADPSCGAHDRFELGPLGLELLLALDLLALGGLLEVVVDVGLLAVASASVGFLSSITPSGSPLTNSTTSGRRSILFSTTVSWLTASQSLLAGSS